MVVVPTDVASSLNDSPSTATVNDSSLVLSTKLSSLSAKLGLPVAAIDGIAKNAAKILSREGSAPGFSNETKMVVSRSGKRPHLVQPKRKSGGLMCDEDCPQFKSAKICSYTVTTAEYSGQLVASYKSAKKMPNLTKLATTDMPKGLRGKHLFPLKREYPPASKSPLGVEVQISPSISTVYQSSISAPVSATVGGSPFRGMYSPCISASFPTMLPTTPSAPVEVEVQLSPSISTVYQPSISATIGGSPFPGMYSPCTSESVPTMPPPTAFSPSASPYPPPFLSPSYMNPFSTFPSRT